MSSHELSENEPKVLTLHLKMVAFIIFISKMGGSSNRNVLQDCSNG